MVKILSKTCPPHIPAADIANFIEKKAGKIKVTLIIHDWGSVVGYRVASRVFTTKLKTLFF